MVVPEPVLALDGAPTVTVAAAGMTRACSVLRWMDGRIHENSARPVRLTRLGEAMARLHDHADAWAPPAGFVRIRWDHETFFGDVMVYGDTPAVGYPEFAARLDTVHRWSLAMLDLVEDT